MTVAAPQLVDLTTATSVEAILGTNVADTHRLVPGGVRAPMTPTKAPPAMFTGKADLLKQANRILQKQLGFANSHVFWFEDSQKHTPRPHKQLAECGYGAWTNSARCVYLFDVVWEQVSAMATRAEQLVFLWWVVKHESLHVKRFTRDWKGGHPTSFAIGFQHEKNTMAKTAKWLARPNNSEFSKLLADPAAKRRVDGIVQADPGAQVEMQHVIDAAPASPADREMYFFTVIAKAGSLPEAVRSELPARALVLTYGY